MSIAEEYRNQIINEFKENYLENYEEGDEFDMFQECYIEEQYNSYNSYPFNQQYNHLVYFLGVAKENNHDGFFKEWDNPQRVYEYGMYFLAREYIMDLKQEDMPTKIDPLTLPQ
jgi:hypothetical protein